MAMKVLFAGGGTAGHINPALAVARKLEEVSPDTDIRFAGVEGKIETKLIPQAGYKLYTVKLHGISRKLNFSGLKNNIGIIPEIHHAKKDMLKILSDFKPDVVVGMGGYAAYPAVWAAKKLKIRVVLMEVNALPGVTTKILAAGADKILVNFDSAAQRLGNRKNILKTGIPVRGGIFADRQEEKQKLGMTDKPLVVSFWGSMGASKMNGIIADFMKYSAETDAFYHVHACGKSGYKSTLLNIAANGVNLAEHKNIDVREYINNMEQLIAAADVIICRAGASTLAEICAAGRCSIIVPSPNVAENHQEINARALEDCGAAYVFTEKDCSAKQLYDTVVELLNNPAKRAEMEKNARGMAVADASSKICDVIRGV